MSLVDSSQAADRRRLVAYRRNDDILTQALPGPDSLRSAIGRPASRGILFVGIVTAALVFWSVAAPLDGGAVAPGIIGPDSSKRTVQHFEGGIIATLHVRDGDPVTAGQPVLTLENVQPKANVDALEADRRTLMATLARLEAERDGRETVTFPAALLQAGDAKTRRIVADQEHLFRSRKTILATRLDVTRRRIAQFEEQSRGLRIQADSAQRQLALLSEEIEGKSHLVKKQLIPKPEVLRLDRAHAEITGRRGEYIAGMARAQEQIGEMEQQNLALQAERAEQVATQLDDARIRLSEVEQKLDAGQDVLKRTVITAPVDGIVVNMKHKTEGGVVVKGEPILDIVPARDHLIVDARVSPGDIDIVRAGLPAQVHLTAYTSRGTPKVAGQVLTVSADRLMDETTRQPYFLARIGVHKAELDQLTPKVDLVPGMAADVMIVTESRTLMSYLVQPFLDAWRRSFREA